MAHTQQLLISEEIDEGILELDTEENTAINLNSLQDDLECKDDLFYEQFASSALKHRSK